MTNDPQPGSEASSAKFVQLRSTEYYSASIKQKVGKTSAVGCETGGRVSLWTPINSLGSLLLLAGE